MAIEDKPVTIATLDGGVKFAATRDTATDIRTLVVSATVEAAEGGATDAPEADPGSDATKAVAVQGVTDGKAVAISAAQLPAALGPQAAAASVGVALSEEDLEAILDLTSEMAAVKLAVESMDATLSALTSNNNLAGVYSPIQIVAVTLTPDTNAYGSGDLLVDTQLVAGAFRANDALGVLHSLVLIDESDNAAFPFDAYFLDANVSMGTENSAPSITDANAANILGFVSIAAADWKDLGGVKICQVKGISLPVKPATGTDDFYIALVNGTGTPTFASNALKCLVGVLS